MTFSFRPARRSEAKPLIGLYAESGRGKTFSALLLARGFVGPKGRIAMIETEAGRGEVYADIAEIGGYDVLPIRGNFAPENFGRAITAAEQNNYDALIIDSASHEWESDGGVLAMAAENQAAGRKGPIVWQKPKLDHQRHFMLRLLATPIPLVIVCMRAKYPMREQEVKGRKEWVRSEVLEPKQADDILYEMTVHGWIDSLHRLRVTKLTRPDLGAVFPDGELITLETGRRLKAWASDSPAPAPSPTLAAAAQALAPQPQAAAAAATTLPPDEPDQSTLLEEWDRKLAKAAEEGLKALQDEWDAAPNRLRSTLKSALDRLYKPRAFQVDAERAALAEEEEQELPY